MARTTKGGPTGSAAARPLVTNTAAFLRLLEHANVKGTIDECVVDFYEDGFAHIAAVDMSNSLFLDCGEDVGCCEDRRIGVSNLGLLCKHLGNGNDPTFELTKDTLVVRNKGCGSIRTTLHEPEQIPTAVKSGGDDAVKKLLKPCTTTVVLTEEVAEKVNYYLGLVPTTGVRLTVEKGRAVLSSISDAVACTVELGKAEGEDLTVEFYSEYLQKLMGGGLLSWEDEAEQPELRVGKSAAVVVYANADNVWAIMPITA